MSKILDHIFGFIKNKNNKVYISINNKRFPLITNFARFFIKGNNNTVVISYDKFNIKHLFFPFGINLRIVGENNTFSIDNPPRIKDFNINIIGENCVVKIGETKQRIADANFYISDGCQLYIGKNAQLKNGGLRIVATDCYKRKAKVVIGDNFLAAQNLLIRPSDGHTLIDMSTNKPVNEPEDIIIGNNVWVGANCTILKGVEVADNSVIGACSLVTHKFSENYVVIAGNPARIIKKGYRWDRHGYGTYMESCCVEGVNKENISKE